VSAEPPDWVADATGGATLRVHVRPGATRTEIAGFHGPALCVRVRARPVEGAANRALLDALGDALGVAPSVLAITGGGRGREKRVHVAGLTADAVRERLAPVIAVDKAGGSP
jgi:uncharacterized protein (TIGR00251 family)